MEMRYQNDPPTLYSPLVVLDPDIRYLILTSSAKPMLRYVARYARQNSLEPAQLLIHPKTIPEDQRNA